MTNNMEKIGIQLTEEQIEQIIRREKQLILETKEKAITQVKEDFENKIKEINKKADNDIANLVNKYQNYSFPLQYDLSVEKNMKSKKRFNVQQLEMLYCENKTVKEMADKMGKSEAAIRQKLYNMEFPLKKELREVKIVQNKTKKYINEN